MEDNAYQRNLILAYLSSGTAREDFETIASIIRERAKDIEVFLAKGDKTSFTVRKKASSRPTLVFSQGPLLSFKPRRGKIYCGQALEKLEQLARLEAAGVPVPKWQILEEGSSFDPEEWGETVVVKPTAIGAAAQGRGIQYVETKNVRWIPHDEFPPNHVGRRGPMIVQKFIDTGDYPIDYRVLCLFGEPLYAMKRASRERQPRPNKQYVTDDPRDLANYPKPKNFGFSNSTRVFSFENDPEILELARMTYNAFPEAPLHGVDLVQEVETGKVYVMQPNVMGITWHFSNSPVVKQPLIDGKRREEQFNAFSLAADVLIEKTRREAE